MVLAITTGVMLFFLTGRVSAKHAGRTANAVAWGAALMLGCARMHACMLSAAVTDTRVPACHASKKDVCMQATPAAARAVVHRGPSQRLQRHISHCVACAGTWGLTASPALSRTRSSRATT